MPLPGIEPTIAHTGQKRPQRMLHPLCGAMWCGVEALRERWRAAGPRRWADGSNRTNRINESCRLARPCPPVKPYIYRTPQIPTTLAARDFLNTLAVLTMKEAEFDGAAV